MTRNVHSSGDIDEKLKRAQYKKGTIEVIGGADSELTTVWTGDEATDPSLHKEHTVV